MFLFLIWLGDVSLVKINICPQLMYMYGCVNMWACAGCVCMCVLQLLDDQEEWEGMDNWPINAHPKMFFWSPHAYNHDIFLKIVFIYF